MLRSIALTLVLALSGTANASTIASPLVVRDDVAFGAHSVTLDTNTGLEWLDLDRAVGLSYNEVVAGQIMGDTFEGWRHATVGEVREMWSGVGIECDDSCHLNVFDARPLFDTLGRTPNVNGFWDVWAITGTPSFLGGPENRRYAYIESGGAFTFTPEEYVLEDTKIEGVGHFLVRSAVPEPSAALLFVGGLLALRGRLAN